MGTLPIENNMQRALVADDARGILGHLSLGDGSETVIVMHEWLGDHSNYAPILPYLDGQRFTYIFADLRGYGLSRSLRGRYTVVEAAEDILRLLDEKKSSGFHVVGHSMSAMVAQRIALVARGRVKSMTGITPVPASGFKVDDATRERMKAIVVDDVAARDAIAVRTANRYGESWLKRKISMARAAATSEAMLGYLAMFTGTDFADEVRGLTLPVLAFAGEHDVPAYREGPMREKFASLYPNASVVVSKEAGHYPMLETPVLLASSIEAFLEKAIAS